MTKINYLLIAIIPLLVISVVPMQSAQATIFTDISDEINRAIDQLKAQLIHQMEVSAQKTINAVIVDNHDLIDDQNEFISEEVDDVTTTITAGTDLLVAGQQHQTQEIEFVVSMLDTQAVEITSLKADIAELKELLNKGKSGNAPGKP